MRPHLDHGALQSRDFLYDIETLVQAFRKIVNASEYQCRVDCGDGDSVCTRALTENGRPVKAALQPPWEILRRVSRTRDRIRARHAVRQLEDSL